MSRKEKNGWICISIVGSPIERGKQYGKLVASEMKEIQSMLRFWVLENTGLEWDFFIDQCTQLLKPIIKKNFYEFYQEMKGFTIGCNEAGTTISFDEIIAWNNYMTIVSQAFLNVAVPKPVHALPFWLKLGVVDRCSAFMAIGDYTKDGKIVTAHNSFADFIEGQWFKVILDINPSDGSRMLMQTCPGWIWSGSDFFITSEGFIGTETTIGGFIPYKLEFPISCRIRKAMQYGKSLDDYERILLEGNSGDYANSWLFGCIKEGKEEIMRIELGLEFHRTERTKNGYFIGFNAAYDPKIRNLECNNSGFNDIRRHQGARKVRLGDLMEQHKGKLDTELAKSIISDHYDVYLNKINPCSRTVCSHYNLDAREYMSDPSRPLPYQPRGTCDGKICDSTMAKNMSFLAKYGASCTIPFNKDEFFDLNRQWEAEKPYVHSRPNESWTEVKTRK